MYDLYNLLLRILVRQNIRVMKLIDQAQMMLNILQEARKIGLHYNVKKTVFQTFIQPSNINVKSNCGSELKEMDNFK